MDELNTKINLIKYLDKVNDLKHIEEKAVTYKAEFFNLNSAHVPPLKYNIVIIFSLMADIVGEFADMIINEPEKAYELLCDLIVVCVKVLTNWDIEKNMIYLSLRVDSLPDVPHLKLSSSPPSTSLFNIQGILISRSTPSKYLVSTVYECSDKSCLGNKGERILELGTVKKCDYCSQERIEVKNGRVLADHVLGVFMPIEFLNFRLTFARCQGITIDFKEDLYSQLELGIQYNIIVKKDQQGFTGWGVKPMLPESLVRVLKKYTPSPYPQSIIRMINNVRELCSTSSWAIVNFFASQIGIDFYPVSSYMQLKTALLLSLASTQGRKCPTSVLALGECGPIMCAAARLCPRALMVTPTLWKPPSGLVSLDAERAWLEAGPLLLASYGVLYIGNLPKFGSQFLLQITSAVDSELVTLQQKPGYCTVDPKILTYPLKAAVWTHWKCNQYSMQDMHQLRTLIDVFGMPYLAEIGCDDETISSCVINTSAGSSNVQEQQIINEDDFREFLGIISAQEVEMSDEASTLIKNYFVASRRERPDSLPIKAVKVLTAMCEAHARLSLRNIATYEDAVASIFLYEESVVALFGKSLMLEAPKRKCNSITSFDLVKEMDCIISEFSDWLESYINALNINDTSTQTSRTSFFI